MKGVIGDSRVSDPVGQRQGRTFHAAAVTTASCSDAAAAASAAARCASRVLALVQSATARSYALSVAAAVAAEAVAFWGMAFRLAAAFPPAFWPDRFHRADGS